MELTNSLVHLKITVKEDVTTSPFTPDDVKLLFADIDRLVGLIINHIDLAVLYYFKVVSISLRCLNWFVPQKG